MITSTEPVKVTDVSMDSTSDYMVVRLPNGTALEIKGDGRIDVFVNDGAEFSHRINSMKKDALWG